MHNSNYTILIIDDDKSVRQSFVSYLQDSDFNVREEPDAGAALKLFDEFIPDLVITDLKMPGMGGLSLLRSIKQRYSDLPVIVISGAGVMNDVVDALRLGADDFLIKPVVDMEVLIHAIKQSLERSQLVLENQGYRAELETVNEQLRGHIESLEQDQRAGHFVQQSMQPISPFSAFGYTCRHKILPALFLSGDCIDIGLLERRYYAFYLADVSGHGSAPAFVTIWLKNLVSQLVRMENLISNFDSLKEPLNELVMALNDNMLRVNLNNHMTMVVGIIDTQTNELFYIVAGHLPLPIVVNASSVEYLEGKGKPVGLFEDCEWQAHQYQLPDACSLLFFSDGILEVIEGKNLVEKEQSLLQLLGEVNFEEDVISQVLSKLDISNAPDDIACLSITRDS